MKSTLKAGVALAALSSAVAMAGTVFAADLGGSIKDGYIEPLPQVSRGSAGPCYFRADVGYSVSRDPEVKWPVRNDVTRNYYYGDGTPANPHTVATIYESVFVTDAVSNVSFDNTWFGQVGMGCGFSGGSRGLRGEVMLGVHGERKLDGEPGFYQSIVEHYDLTTAPPPTPVPPNEPPVDYDDPLHTNLKSYTAMVNFYHDLGKFGRVTPYVGAGLGVAYNMLDEVYFTENPNLTNRIAGNRDLSFAWSVMAGVGYQVNERAILDVGYRYLDLGQIESGRVDSAGFVNPAVRVDDITAHEFKVGLRYHFGQADCCAASYMPMK